MAGAGDGNVAEAGVEQIRMDAGIGVHKDVSATRSASCAGRYGASFLRHGTV
jgi:hypothetical protein